MIVGSSGSGKTNALLYLINHEAGIAKIYLNAKDPYEAKNQKLINKREIIGLKYSKIKLFKLNDSKSFIARSNDMDDVY